MVRVRRHREAEPLEALELSFDKASNTLKRQRLVTQSDALVAQFNAVIKLDERKSQEAAGVVPQEESKEGGFVLGAKIAKTSQTVKTDKVAEKDGGRSVTLRKLMPDAQGKTLDEIKQYHLSMIQARRDARRQEILKSRRMGDSTAKDSDGQKQQNDEQGK